MSAIDAMETVEITIGGRRFRLQCGPGESGHVQALARTVDACATTLVQGQNGLGEEKLLLLSTLMLADKLDDAQVELDELRQELGRVAGVIAERGQWIVGTAARRLDALARKIERATDDGDPPPPA